MILEPVRLPYESGCDGSNGGVEKDDSGLAAGYPIGKITNSVRVEILSHSGDNVGKIGNSIAGWKATDRFLSCGVHQRRHWNIVDFRTIRIGNHAIIAVSSVWKQRIDKF